MGDRNCCCIYLCIYLFIGASSVNFDFVNGQQGRAEGKHWALDEYF